MTVLKYHRETERVSLGYKQLHADPWESVDQRYPVGQRLTGKVVSLTDYGAFVELEPGVEGLVHVSEMSWTKKNSHPGKIVSTSQEVEVMVLEVDPNKRRISLGLKQCYENPWESFLERYPVGTEIKGDIKNITEFGLFVGLDGEIDGMVHLSDINWVRQGDEVANDYKKGDEVRAKVLDIDAELLEIPDGGRSEQIVADPGHHRDLGTAQSGGDRLIGSLAAGKDLVGRTGEGLAGPGDVFDGVHVVDIERAEVEDFHAIAPGRFALERPVVDIGSTQLTAAIACRAADSRNLRSFVRSMNWKPSAIRRRADSASPAGMPLGLPARLQPSRKRCKAAS